MQPHLQLLPGALWPFPLCFVSCIMMFCSLKRRSKQAVAAFFFPLSLVLEVAHYLTVLIQCLFNVGTDKAFAGFPGYLIHMFYKVCRWHNSCQKMALRCYSFAILIFHHSADIYMCVCVYDKNEKGRRTDIYIMDLNQYFFIWLECYSMLCSVSSFALMPM